MFNLKIFSIYNMEYDLSHIGLLYNVIITENMINYAYNKLWEEYIYDNIRAIVVQFLMKTKIKLNKYK